MSHLDIHIAFEYIFKIKGSVIMTVITVALNRKGESQTYATFSDADHVELSGQAGNKEHYLSILPTIVKVFSSPFLFGALLKFLYDVLQFISPQILRLVFSIFLSICCYN